MSDDLKKIEIEIAKVRLAKEQLELRDALRRADRKQRIEDRVAKVLSGSKAAARATAGGIAELTPRQVVSWSKVFFQFVVAGSAFLVYASGLPESKNNALVGAFFLGAAFALYGAILFVKKVLQLIFH